MRKLKLFLTLLMLMCIGITQMWATDKLAYTIEFQPTTSNSSARTTSNFVSTMVTSGDSYISSCTATAYAYPDVNQIKLGSSSKAGSFTLSLSDAGKVKATKVVLSAKYYDSGKTIKLTANSTTGTFTPTNAFADYEVTLDGESDLTTIKVEGVTASKGRMYVNAIKVYVADSGDDPGDDPDPGTQKTDVTDEQLAWSAASAEVTMEAENTFPTLTNTLPLDVTYQSTAEAVATIDANGDVTLVKAGTTTIKAIFAGNDDYNAKTVSYTLTVNPAPLQPIAGGVIDVLNSTWSGITGSNYGDLDKNAPTTDAHYKGSIAGTSNTIQLRASSNSGIVSTVSGGKVKRIEVVWNSSTAADRQLDIYGKNTAYTASSDVYSSGTRGTSLGNIKCGTSTYLDIEGDYDYIGFRSNSGAMYFDEIRITWIPTEKHELTYDVAESGHGTLAASVGGAAINSGAQVAEGATVTLTPTADTYYQVNTVEVLDGNDDEVTTTENAGVYTFAMPASDAVAEVSFAYIPVTKLTLNKEELALLVDAEETLSVSAVEPEGAFAGVNWTTSAAGVATVDETGKVTAKAAGTATITATSVATGTITATCAVTVTAPTGHEIGITSANGTVVATSGDDEIDVADVLKDVAVVLTATPNAGYTISGWTVVGAEYTVSEDKTTCSFTMPDDEVLVEVTYTHEVAVLKLHDANGESIFDGENTHYWKEEVTLPTEAAACSKTFVGWSANPYCATAPELDATYVLPNKGVNDIYAVYASVVSAGVTSYVKTALADIVSGSVVVITHDNGSLYAMSNDKGTSKAPTAIAVTDEGGVLTEGVADNVLWTITKDGNNLSFAKGNDKLYCTNSNDGVRVGSGSANSFLINSNYLYETGTPDARYLGVYKSQDWRCYTSINSNIQNQTLAFYKKTVSDPVYGDYSTTCQPQAAAPTFDVAAGTYYEGKSIQLTSTTENATIYYTIDGSAPSTSSTKYTAAISLSERAVVTVKAIAVAEGYENSEVAEATYNINLPYDFAVFAALTKEDGKEYAVRGIISEKGELNTQYNELPYWISADGSTTGQQIKCHNGLGLNKVEFTTESAAAVNPGDNVTVVGTWSKQYSNIGAANWMLEYTARVPAEPAYEIAGNLTTNSFDEGEAFDAGILANLSVNALFTNGYKEAVDGVTFTYGEKATWEAGDETLTVTAVKNEENLVSREFGVTVTSATLESIALKEDDGDYQTKKVYYIGDAFVAPTIVATLSDESTVEAVATYKEGFDNTTDGVQNVTVSYTRGEITKETSYDVTVKAIYNDESHPHTVAEALYIIGEFFKTSTASSDSIVVEGIVSTVDKIESNSLIYYISDNGQATNELEVYKGKYLNKANFNNDNILKVGDEVVVKGKVKTYNNIKEFDSNSRLVSLARSVEVTVANVAELEVGQADLAVEDLTITTLSEGAVTLVSGDEAIATIKENKIHAVAAGEVTITANVAANGIYKAASAEFTVNVVATKDRYTVTFSTGEAGENVSGDAPEAIANQLENAPVTLPACTWTWEGHKFTGWAVTAAGEPVEVENNQFNMPAANVTITAQWAEVVTAKISFMVGGEEKASIYKEQEVAFTIEQDGAAWAPAGFTFVGWSTTEYAEETAVAPATITEYTPQAGIAEVSLYGIYSRLDNSSASYGKYVKATVVAEGDYLIVCEDQNKVFDGSLTSFDATGNYKSATIADGVVTLANADNYKFTLAAVTGGYSIKSASGYYIGCTGTKNALNTSTTEAYVNTVSVGEITSSGGPKLQYFKTSGQERFRYYASSQEAIQLYKKNTGTMWFTSSPVEKVAITFDANGGQGGCQKAIITKGDQLTICETAPTKSHSEFAGWKNGDDEYIAGQAYTFNANITLTAQWNDAPTFTVTFDKNGGTGTAENLENQYAGDEITLPAALTKAEFTFQGWKYGSKLYKAGASFILPAANIEFVAQWRKASVPVDKMSMVTSASALSNGMPIALGCSYGENSFAMAGDFTGSNKYMTSVTDGVSLSDGVATYTDAVVVMTLEQVENGWKITKDGTNYLNETSVKNLAWTTKENATIWSISFSGNNVKISSANGTMKFNAQDPRFTTYASGQKDIQLFGKAIVIDQGDSEDPVNVNISDLGYTEGEAIIASGANVTLTIDEPTTVPSITAQNGATVVIDEPTTTESVVVEEGSKIVANAETTAPTVYFSTTMGVTDNNGDFHGVASELGEVTNITLATGGEIIYDLTLGTNKDGVQADPNQWHAFSLPFAVDALNGIFDAVTGEKLENEVNYAIMDYHGDIRANGQYGWKKYRGILQPGVFYLMTVDGNTKTFRFKASVTGPMSETNSMSAKAYDGAGEDSDKGWNGFGNPRWIGGTFAHNAQYLDPYTYEYVTITPGMTVPVGLPFFYKADETSEVYMGEVGASYAPARNKAYEIKKVAVRFGNEVSKDKLYISASEDALNEYEQDKDLVKMFMSQTPKVARISGNAYGMKLAMVNAPMVNDQATYGLTLYAPQAGEYTISAPAMDNADLYLTYEGSIIWNLSMGAYTAEFEKGNNEGYGLLLVKKIPMTPTGIEDVQGDKVQCTKVIINEHVYILRAEQMYDVTGKAVK